MPHLTAIFITIIFVTWLIYTLYCFIKGPCATGNLVKYMAESVTRGRVIVLHGG